MSKVRAAAAAKRGVKSRPRPAPRQAAAIAPIERKPLNEANTAWIENPDKSPGQPAMIPVPKDSVHLGPSRLGPSPLGSSTSPNVTRAAAADGDGVGGDGGGDLSIAALVGNMSLKQQAQFLGLKPSHDTKERGAEYYSTFIPFGDNIIFILELEPDEIKTFQDQSRAIDAELALLDQDNGKLTDAEAAAVVERVNAVPRRRIEFYEEVINHCNRGCVQMHPFNAARVARLYASQKMELAHAILQKSQMGSETISFWSAS